MPIITLDRQIVAFCMPKTASSFIETVLAAERGAYRVLDQHDPAWLVNREEGREHDLASIPLHLGTTRDPWSWYGSLWAHAFHHPLQGSRSFPRRPFSAVLAYSKGKTDFKSFLHGATHLDELDLPYEWLGAIWVPRAGGPLPGRGLWSWAVDYMHAGGKVVQLLDGNQPKASLRALGLAADLAPVNTSAGTHEVPVLTDWSARYDAEMVEWVERADEELCTPLGYVAPFAASRFGPLIPWIELPDR